MYVRELDDRKLDRAVALDRMSSRSSVKVELEPSAVHLSVPSSATLPWSVQDGSLPKIALHAHARDNVQEVDSDQESVRNTSSDNRQAQTKVRRHTLPPILPESEL